MAVETLEEIAERIAVEWIPRGPIHDSLRRDILAALHNERERAAKLLERRRDQYALVDSVEADVTRIICTQLAAAIREGR